MIKMGIFKHFGKTLATENNSPVTYYQKQTIQDEFRQLGGLVSLRELRQFIERRGLHHYGAPTVPAAELKKVWDYRKAGLKIGEAREKLREWISTMYRYRSPHPRPEEGKWARAAQRIREWREEIINLILGMPYNMHQISRLPRGVATWWEPWVWWEYGGQLYITQKKEQVEWEEGKHYPIHRKTIYITYRWPTEKEWAEILSAQNLLNIFLALPMWDLSWRKIITILASKGQIQKVEHSRRGDWRSLVVRALPPQHQPSKKYRAMIAPYVARKRMLG